MRTELEAGRYPEVIDILVASTHGIDVRAAFKT
jgi:hypothetical protein